MSRAKNKGTGSAKKEPKSTFSPQVEKKPRIPAISGGQLVWRFSSADKNGPFSWSALSEPAAYKEVLEKLHNFETMHEGDIAAQGSHAVELESLCKEARDRLSAIKLDDLDALMSFRLTGERRVWCRVDANVMHVLWWDPDHAVCPSHKKHT